MSVPPPEPSLQPVTWTRLIAPAFACALVLVSAVRTFVGAMVRDHRYHNDLEQHVYWGQRAWGADLMRYDPLAAYFASDVAAQPLWKVLVPLMGAIGEIQVVAEFAAMLLFLATCVLMYRLGRHVSGSSWGGVMGAASVPIFIRYAEWMTSGLLQRSFAVPLTALCVYALLRRKMWLLGLTFVGCGLIYPVGIATIGGLAVVHEALRLVRDRKLPAGWWLAFIGGVVSLVLILVFRSPPPEIGPTVTYEQTLVMPEFQKDGRNEFFRRDDPAFFWIEHHRSGLRMSVRSVRTCLLWLLAAWVIAGPRAVSRIPPVAWMAGVVSLGMFFLAHAVPFKLYLPNRHVASMLPISWALLMACVLPAAGRNVMAVLRVPKPAWPVLALAAWLFVTYPWAIQAANALRNRGEQRSERMLYEFLRTTPPDTLFAALPVRKEGDQISLRSGRPVLVYYNHIQAYYPKWFNEVLVPRARASTDAYYATSWDDVDRLADAWGVHAFVWRAHTLQRLPRIEPMRTMARETVERLVAEATHGGRVVPVMYEPPADRLLWWAGDVRVIRVGSGPASYTPPGPVEPLPKLPPVDLRNLLADDAVLPDDPDDDDEG